MNIVRDGIDGGKKGLAKRELDDIILACRARCRRNLNFKRLYKKTYIIKTEFNF